MTRVLGIVGGIGPESTIDYYRSLLARYQARTGRDNNPRVIIHSVDLRPLLDALAVGNLDFVASCFTDALESLARAGADLALLAANTAHIVFPTLVERSPLPLLSIVEATYAEARRRALTRLAILGTGYTMGARFYPDLFEPRGIALVLPEESERKWIHEIYLNELIPGLFLPETRSRLLTIVDNIRVREGIDGVILAGTELPLILRQESHNGVPFLDTTAIHVDAAIDAMTAPS